jgi:hypothetical protein
MAYEVFVNQKLEISIINYDEEGKIVDLISIPVDSAELVAGQILIAVGEARCLPE